MYSKIQIQEKLQAIEVEKLKYETMLNDIERLSPDQELAVMLQRMFYIGDSWKYEFTDNKHDWNGYWHTKALKQADIIIKFVTENFRCTDCR